MIIPFLELEEADLVPGAIYQSGKSGNFSDDPIAKLFKLKGGFKGIQNRGGIRRVKVEGIGNTDEEAYVVLVSTGNNKNWPDYYDEKRKILTYYGDNDKPNNHYLNTALKGNASLIKNFNLAYGDSVSRTKVAPFFYFRTINNTRDIMFVGLALPIVQDFTIDEVLKIKSFSDFNSEYENIVAQFTIIDNFTISREWLYELKTGNKMHSINQPFFWIDFINKGPNFNLNEINLDVTKYQTDIKALTELKSNTTCAVCECNLSPLLIETKLNQYIKVKEKRQLSNEADDGIILCKNHKQLFDLGLFSFDEEGYLIISEKLSKDRDLFSNINFIKKLEMNDNRNELLRFHRKNILLGLANQRRYKEI